MSKLLNNLPIEDLNEDNDYLGIIDKGQIIKTFLESNTDEFKDIKMFSLYGEWGSGKSTLMKYLQKELKGDFNTFFFEAWQFESDSNLSLSLLEYLLRNSQDITEEALGEMYNTASILFKGFVKSTKITFPVGLANVSIDRTKMVEVNKKKPKSFLELKDEFKIKFRKWEDNKTSRKPNKFNIVFIDDLDRCEPENVLNLLSALKLFFTYGEKTIFLCGIDKKAVNEAVKTKYGEVVKANEYLEKIFDISFSMPVQNELLKLVSQYFQNEELKGINNTLEQDISDFFNAINFTNPRRVKKVLNKYSIIKNLKVKSENDSSKKIKIPSIITKSGGNYLETIIVLYLIIIHEFHSSILENTFNLDLKLKSFEKAIEESAKLGDSNNIQSHIARNLSQGKAQFSYVIKKIVNDKISLSDIIHNNYALNPQNERSRNYLKGVLFLNVLFCPLNIESMVINSLTEYNLFKSSFRVKTNLIDYYFTEYLLHLFSKSDYFKNLSLIPIIEFKNIIKNLS